LPSDDRSRNAEIRKAQRDDPPPSHLLLSHPQPHAQLPNFLAAQRSVLHATHLEEASPARCSARAEVAKPETTVGRQPQAGLFAEAEAWQHCGLDLATKCIWYQNQCIPSVQAQEGGRAVVNDRGRELQLRTEPATLTRQGRSYGVADVRKSNAVDVDGLPTI
jgi:hypothetical protein